MIPTFENPGNKLPEQTEGRVRYDDVGLVTKGADFRATEVAVTLQIVPLQVVDVDAAAAVRVAGEFENLSLDAGLVDVEQRAFRFEEGGLVVLVLLALDGVGRADEAFQTQTFEVLGEETGEVGPLGVVARQEDGLVAKGVRVVLQVGIDFFLDVGVLGVKLVVLGSLSGAKIRVVGHKLRFVGIGLYSMAASEDQKKAWTVSNPHQRP